MPTVFLRPTTDHSNDGWADEGSGTTDIFEHIDEVTPSDSDYIFAVVTSADDTDIYETDLGPMAGVADDVTLRIRHRLGTSSQSGDILWELLDNDDVVIASGQEPTTTETWTTDTVTISLSDFHEHDLSNVILKLTASWPGVGTHEQQVSWVELEYDTLIYRPTSDDSLSGWTDDGGGTTDIYQAIDEVIASDSDYVTATVQSGAAGPDTYQFALGDMSAIDTDLTGILRIRYQKPGAGTAPHSLEIRDALDVVMVTPTLPTPTPANWQTSYIQIDGADLEGNDLTDVQIRFILGAWTAGDPVDWDVSWIELQWPGQLYHPTNDRAIGDWEDEAAGTTDIFEHVDEGVLDSGDYVTDVADIGS